MIIAPGSSLLFIGDSITDCGRARPVGESSGGLGNGYVSLVDAYLKAKRPSSRIRIQNMGVSGDTVRHLANRWETDVMDQEPDWVCIMIGVNDVWRQLDRYLEVEQHVRLPEYRSTLANLVERTLEQSKVVLMTPFIVEPNIEDPMRSLLDDYGASVQEIANAHNTEFIDTQAIFDEMTVSIPAMALCSDRIHVNTSGHMALALAFLEIRAL
ncbi:MAG: SGNH/GDSL hydrolase family protein [Fimbriimonadaceae bacterium]|nr:SGNH/GDSL hydrolase family protein [Fimbriimonadaceae bacterium]